VQIGNNLDEGIKIETAISGLSATSVAHLEPKRQNHHKVKTIDGITKLFYFQWPIEGDYAGFIQAQCLPHIGKFYQFSPTPISKPSPTVSSHSLPEKQWNISLSHLQGKQTMSCIFIITIFIYIYCIYRYRYNNK
jgi:hypothetical protein